MIFQLTMAFLLVGGLVAATLYMLGHLVAPHLGLPPELIAVTLAGATGAHVITRRWHARRNKH